MVKATLAFFLIITVLGGCRKSTKQISEIVVAQVGPYSMSSQEFANELAVRLKSFDALTAKSSKNIERVKADIFRDFLVQSITQIYAKKKNIQLSEEEINAEVSKIRATYPNDLAFRRNLAREHVSLESWKEEVRFTLLQQKVTHSLREAWTEPSEDEMKKFYENNPDLFKTPRQIRVRQVVTEREDKAKLFLKKIRKGSSLKSLSEYSSGPESKNNGETGWIDVDTLDVFKKAYALPVGSRTRILQSPFGYHIIEVLGKRKGGKKSFKKSQEIIKQHMLADVEQKKYSAWLDEQIRSQSVLKNEKVIASISVITKEE